MPVNNFCAKLPESVESDITDFRTVASRLQRVVEDSGIAQAEIARRCRQTPQWVSNRLLGAHRLQAHEIPVFAQALRMDVCKLACQLLRDVPPDLDEQRRQLDMEGTAILTDLWRSVMGSPEQAALTAIADIIRQYQQQAGGDPRSGS